MCVAEQMKDAKSGEEWRVYILTVTKVSNATQHNTRQYNTQRELS